MLVKLFFLKDWCINPATSAGISVKKENGRGFLYCTLVDAAALNIFSCFTVLSLNCAIAKKGNRKKSKIKLFTIFDWLLILEYYVFSPSSVAPSIPTMHCLHQLLRLQVHHSG